MKNTIKYRTESGFKQLRRITTPLTFVKGPQVLVNYVDLAILPVYLFVEIENAFYKQNVKLVASIDVNTHAINLSGELPFLNFVTGYGIVCAEYAVKLPIKSKISIDLQIRTK